MSLLEALSVAARQAASLRRTEHRPWPLPDAGWLVAQTWEDLLFAHWPVPEARLRPHVPEGLELDTRDGSAWLGMTPGRVSGIRVRGTLPLPRLSDFLELGVRTYVTARDGRPGIWFLSVDASSPLAVGAARRLYRLPASRARIEARSTGDDIAFECARMGARGLAFSARYGPVGEPAEPGGGSVERFLTERYCLYAEAKGTLYRAEIHHGPWPLQPADAEIALNTMPPAGLRMGARAPLLRFSRRHDVLIWPLEPLDR